MQKEKELLFQVQSSHFSTITVKSIISEMKGNKMILLELKIAFWASKLGFEAPLPSLEWHFVIDSFILCLFFRIVAPNGKAKTILFLSEECTLTQINFKWPGRRFFPPPPFIGG